MTSQTSKRLRTKSHLSEGVNMISRKKTALGAVCVSLVSSALVSGPGAEAESGTWPLEARHPEAPTIENPSGGPVLASPRVVPILYADDPLLPDLEAFYAKLGTSSYLPTSLAEYGVGKPTIVPSIIEPGAGPASIDDVAASSWLIAQIAAGALPAEDGNTVYSLVYPATTQVTAGELLDGYPFPLCGAYSEATQTATGALVPFTISGLCEGSTGTLTDLESETVAEAQSLAGAFTDPGSFINPAYVDYSWSASALEFYASPWVSFLCDALPAVQPSVPSDLGYSVLPIWSDRAALAGHDPCIVEGIRRAVYFNAAPETTGTSVGYNGFAKGVSIPPGGSITVRLHLFSDGPTGEWTLGAAERTDVFSDPYGLLTFTFDESTGKNGDVRALTIHRAVAPDGSVATNLGFDVTSTLGSTVHEWPVLVGTY